MLGTKYLLDARLDLSPEEVELLKKDNAYQAYPLFEAAEWNRGLAWYIVPESLHKGRVIEGNNPGEILIAEQRLKEGCKNLHNRIRVGKHRQANPSETIRFDD
jgi:hypothetical protein